MTDDLAATLYREIVLDHHRQPRRRGVLDAPTHAADGANPLCGDRLRIELRCVAGRIDAYAFTADACAIATASSSMLGDWATANDATMLDDLDDLGERFERLVSGAIGHDPALGDLNAFAALARYPSRRKCALLAIATLRAALRGDVAASTETA